MPTVAEALQNAADALNNAVTNVLSLRKQIEDRLTAITTNVTTIINNFNARPLFMTMFVDPADGVDTNDGLSLAKPKKSIDSILTAVGSQGVQIVLLGNDVIKLRHNVQTNIFIVGAQRMATPAGWGNSMRTVGFLGEAQNSPSSNLGTMSAGIFFAAGQLFASSIVWDLPNVPANINQRPHFSSSAFLNVQLLSGTIVASGAGASALFGSFNGGRSVVTFSGITLGTNAAGHVFDGIAAGADPNAYWSYQTNLKAA